jgi:hypothetical protein
LYSFLFILTSFPVISLFKTHLSLNLSSVSFLSASILCSVPSSAVPSLSKKTFSFPFSSEEKTQPTFVEKTFQAKNRQNVNVLLGQENRGKNAKVLFTGLIIFLV